MLRMRFRRSRMAFAAWTMVLGALLAGRPAAAQTILQVDGAWDLGYSTGTGASQDAGRFFTDVRPGLALQFGSPRLAWRASYGFSGSLIFDGRAPSYAQQLAMSLAAQTTSRSTLAFSVSAAQGSTLFHLAQRAPATSQPEFRAPDNPSLVTALLGQSFGWDASPTFRLRQDLSGALSAPQDSLGRYSVALAGSLALERLFQDDAVGVVLRPSLSLLSPASGEGSRYASTANSLLGSWNHDFDRRWNGQVTAGVEQVLTFTGSYPLAIVPTGSLTARYLANIGGGSLSYTRAAATSLQTGTVSMSDMVTLRALVIFDSLLPRALAASAGFAHAEPLGETAAQVAAGTGNALQGDVRLAWSLSAVLLATASYSASYQFGQPSGLAPPLAHVFLVGLTARYVSARYTPPMPSAGGRVDGSDAVGFPGAGAPSP